MSFVVTPDMRGNLDLKPRFAVVRTHVYIRCVLYKINILLRVILYKVKYNVNGHIILHVESTKFLGIIIHEYLLWYELINMVKSKVSKCIGTLSTSLNCLTKPLYYAFMFPYFTRFITTNLSLLWFLIISYFCPSQ